MRPPRSGCGGVPMSGAAKDSRNALKVRSDGLGGLRVCAHVYLGALDSGHVLAGLRVPGGGTSSNPAPPSYPWEREASVSCFPPSTQWWKNCRSRS